MIGVSYQPGVARALSIDFIDAVKPVLEDEGRTKIAHDVKAVTLELAKYGVEARGFRHDVMLYAFLLCADPSACSPSVLAERYLDRKLGAAAEQHADLAVTLAERLAPEIDEQGFRELYETIDLPLAGVLARMEQLGIRVDPAQLRVLSGALDIDIQRLSAEIYELAGKPFNINSPAQLGKILFEELNLPAPVKYGKGKTISTAADVLEGLAAEHEIARKVLEYRQLSKLKGTYIDALPELIDPKTGRASHHVQSDGRGDGAAVVIESESAKHSDPHRAGPRDSRRIRAARGLEAGGGGLFADRAAAAGAHVARSGIGGRVPARRGYSYAHGGRSFSRSSADGDAGHAAQRQGGEFRHRVRADAVWFGGVARHRSQGSRAVHPDLFRAARGREEVYPEDHRGSARERIRADAVRAQAADPGYAQPQSERAIVSPSGRP